MFNTKCPKCGGKAQYDYETYKGICSNCNTEFKMLNSDRHFYFYAKYHYAMSENKFDDLKKLQSEYCGCSVEHITKKDVTEHLLRMAYRFITDYGKFLDFLLDIDPKRTSMVGYNHNTSDYIQKEVEYDYFTALVHKCLSVIRFAKVDDIPGELGEPNPNLLPFSETKLKMLAESQSLAEKEVVV